MILDTEAAVMANFEFLAQADVGDLDDDEDMSDDLDDQGDDDQDDVKTARRKGKVSTLAPMQLSCDIGSTVFNVSLSLAGK